MAKTKKSRVKDSLIAQLQAMGADTPVFLDLVDKYMAMWDTVDAMQADIRSRGLFYSYEGANGQTITKDNPNVKLMPGYIRQMQSLLHDMGITTDNILTGDGDDTL